MVEENQDFLQKRLNRHFLWLVGKVYFYLSILTIILMGLGEGPKFSIFFSVLLRVKFHENFSFSSNDSCHLSFHTFSLAYDKRQKRASVVDRRIEEIVLTHSNLTNGLLRKECWHIPSNHLTDTV